MIELRNAFLKEKGFKDLTDAQIRTAMFYEGLEHIQKSIEDLRDEMFIKTAPKGSKIKTRLSALKKLETDTRKHIKEALRGYTQVGKDMYGWCDGFVLVVPEYEHNYKTNGYVSEYGDRLKEAWDIEGIKVSVSDLNNLRKVMKAELGTAYKTQTNRCITFVYKGENYWFDIERLLFGVNPIQDDEGNVLLHFGKPRTMLGASSDFGKAIVMPINDRNKDGTLLPLGKYFIEI